MNKRTIKAIHEYDLEKFLESIGLLDNIRTGTIVCARCRKPVTLETFDSIGRFNDKLKTYCNRSDCRQTLEDDNFAG